MKDEFRALLLETGISQATIEILEQNGLTDEETLADTTESQLEGKEGKLGDIKRLKRLFPKKSAAASLEITVTDQIPRNRVNPYQHLLHGNSAVGIDLSALGPNIRGKFIERAAKATSAYALITGGILEIFDAKFWQELALVDLDLRIEIDEWIHQKDSQLSISNSAIESLKRDVECLYSSSFDQMVQTLTTFSAQKKMLSEFGAQAQINVGTDAFALTSLTQLVPLVAEELTDKMLKSRLPEQAGRLIKVISSLFEILKDDRLHQGAGIATDNADEAVLKFLQRRLDQSMVNRFRLALAYERLVKALAHCPAPEQVSMDYLEILGTLGGNLGVYYSLVVPTIGLCEPFSKISALALKNEKPTATASNATYASSGWPFVKWTRPVPANRGGILAFAFGPSTGYIKGSRIDYGVLADINAQGALFGSLIWLGEPGQKSANEQEGMNGCKVEKLYCELGGEPQGNNQFVKVFYKSREELIEMAITAAAGHGVTIAVE